MILKQVLKVKVFDGFQIQGRITYLSEMQVKNVTAMEALIQIINLSHFAVKYLLDLTLSSKDGRVVPRHKSDFKVHNLLDPCGRQKFKE